jgi:hypothetical protein
MERRRNLSVGLINLSMAQAERESRAALASREERTTYAAQRAKSRLQLLILSVFLGLAASAGIYYDWRGRALKRRLEKERVEREPAQRTEDVRDMAQELAHKLGLNKETDIAEYLHQL